MECPLCGTYEGSHRSVRAHICGSHDGKHASYVGLKDNGEPLSRLEREQQKEAQEEADNRGVPTEVDTEAGSDHDLGDLAVVGAGAALYANQQDITLDDIRRKLSDDDERDTI